MHVVENLHHKFFNSLRNEKEKGNIKLEAVIKANNDRGMAIISPSKAHLNSGQKKRKISNTSLNEQGTCTRDTVLLLNTILTTAAVQQQHSWW